MSSPVIYAYAPRVKVDFCWKETFENNTIAAGMALSLGDKINAAQKQATNKEATQSRGKQHAGETAAVEE